MGFAVEEPLQPFMGRKERRRSSAGKLFLGGTPPPLRGARRVRRDVRRPSDAVASRSRLSLLSLLSLLKRPDHCDLRSSPEVVKLLAKHGEPPLVLFSEEVLKINRRGEAVPRIMLVAANAVYLLDAETKRARRRMATRALSCVRMSEFADNFLALVCPAEYDVLLVCSRKIEAVMAMRDAKRAASGASAGDKGAAFDLPVEIGESFVYAAGADATKRVTFVRLENGEVDTTIRDAT
jgi:hypothetical protein